MPVMVSVWPFHVSLACARYRLIDLGERMRTFRRCFRWNVSENWWILNEVCHVRAHGKNVIKNECPYLEAGQTLGGAHSGVLHAHI
jgi:hypothetical protein